MNILIPALTASILGGLPPGFAPVGEMQVDLDHRPALLRRAERIDGENAGLEGEHVSVIHDRSGALLGYARMTRDMAQPAALPSREAAQEVAMQLLEQLAPDLRAAHEVHWIEPHDEEITIQDNGKPRKLLLRGMKVKMRATTQGQLWFWVIVGPENKVMVFERDIYWVTLPGHRRTEKWLHDTWLAERGNAAWTEPSHFEGF